MLIFTQYKDSFFHGAVFINCFQIFKWTLQENSFYLGYPVFINMSVQTNNLQTQTVEITLIQCCFNVMMLKQHWANVTSTPCLLGNCLEMYHENIHNGVEGYSLSKITKIYFHCTSSNETSKITQTVILEEKRLEAYSGPSQRPEWIILKKIKTTSTKVCKNFHVRRLRGSLTRS